MTNEKFTAFIDLIQFDQETVKIRNKIDKLISELEILKEKEKNFVDHLEGVHQHWLDMRKEVDEHELEMKDLDQQEQEQKRRLDLAKNEKEYRSAKAEIDTLKTRQTELEAKLVGAWHKLEQAEREYNKQKEETEKETAELQTTIKEKEEAIAQTKKALEQQQLQRETKSVLVPQEWLEKYAAMAGRVTDPAVPVEQNSCSACFHMITSEDIIDLDKNRLLQCKGCYRFLYLPQIMVSEEKETT